ncbi:hypothetical protein A4X13_0g7921 [Tilletia indica]|uniref:Uncharacterized protein n=1 Tax=Tilletia indica TaxID=43049 RepID=A0A177TVG5_9BASI|nr:hypothetical protein A4X13_0g7921 [Tilletia indica]
MDSSDSSLTSLGDSFTMSGTTTNNNTNSNNPRHKRHDPSGGSDHRPNKRLIGSIEAGDNSINVVFQSGVSQDTLDSAKCSTFLPGEQHSFLTEMDRTDFATIPIKVKMTTSGSRWVRMTRGSPTNRNFSLTPKARKHILRPFAEARRLLSASAAVISSAAAELLLRTLD